MNGEDLIVGQWYRSPEAKGQVFRYDGRGPDDSYVFSKFVGDHESPGELLATIEIYNLESLQPCLSDGG